MWLVLTPFPAPGAPFSHTISLGGRMALSKLFSTCSQHLSNIALTSRLSISGVSAEFSCCWISGVATGCVAVAKYDHDTDRLSSHDWPPFSPCGSCSGSAWGIEADPTGKGGPVANDTVTEWLAPHRNTECSALGKMASRQILVHSAERAAASSMVQIFGS
eukprot:CAMPEP_0117659912 /NCGR_PEP_ID=MMETSP0804-20121206/6682_1 /TAXON_ID=1074897 /ORGANISM="Tetraselmis astigmatica, Strain CCMP880" /LENGTH=160 /DNA_ID=CAMNT_0005466595 /DNA_START=1597 /DNA_END=2079 /DNA_ORIENTATION=+